MERRAYPGDVRDGEWTFAAPCLTLPSEEALQREHALQEALNGRRYIACSGAPRRMTPHGLAPWHGVNRIDGYAADLSGDDGACHSRSASNHAGDDGSGGGGRQTLVLGYHLYDMVH